MLKSLAALFVAGLLCGPGLLGQVPSLTAPLDEARKQVSQGHLREAETLLVGLIAQDGRFAPAYELLGIVYDREHRYGEADRAFQQAIELRPKAAGPHVNLGASLLERGERARALQESRIALELDPHNVTAAVNVASALSQEKKFCAAAHYLELAKSLQPHDRNVLLELTKADFGCGKTGPALKTAAALTRLANLPEPFHFSLGLVLAQNSAYEQAVPEFERIAGPGTSSVEVFLNLGLCYSRLHRYDRARNAYFQAIELNPQDSAAYYRLGADCLGEGRAPQAMAWLSRAVHLNPDYPDPLFLLGKTLVDEGYEVTAQEHLGRYVKFRPGDPKGWAVLGDAYQRDGQDNKAMACYQKTLELLPGVASSHYLVGYSYFRQKKFAEAKSYFQQTLRLDPSNADAHLRLGEMAFIENDNTEAERQFKTALAAEPGQIDAATGLVKIYLRANNGQSAEKLLQELTARSPNDPRFHYQLSQLWRKQGSAGRAQQEFVRFQQLQEKQQQDLRYLRHSSRYE